ncbi:PIN domain-containing protein [Metallosphaera javensis (ex Sakai et al. 2022)]|uniref:PIN domain-containing protein n=1 Tax=Metallosphaera javensis (ex Sakai et al. 2022) TaxID=2775498 RepID=UPI003CE510F8
MGPDKDCKLSLISVFEIAYFLVKHGVDLKVIGEVIRDPKINVVPNEVEDISYAISHLEEIKGYGDFNDFMIIFTSKRLNLELLTFD